METLKPISFAVFRELIQSILLLFSISVFLLLLLYVAPGNVLLDEYIASLREASFHDIDSDINFSFFETYFFWLSAYLSGNFGSSSSNGMPVMPQVIDYSFNTLKIVISAFLLSLTVALPLALFRQQSFGRRPMLIGLNILSTLPLFWLCYISIYFSGQWFGYFPLAFDFENITVSQFILPVLLLSLGSGVLIEMIQLISDELKRVMNEEYILYARAKGASVFFHAFKEGIIFPVLNIFSQRMAYLFGACIIVEQIFNWPGIGRILWQSTQDRDIPLLLSAVLVSVFIIRLFFFFTRIVYISLNPRASHE